MKGAERNGNKQSQKAREEKDNEYIKTKDRETILEVGKKTKEN